MIGFNWERNLMILTKNQLEIFFQRKLFSKLLELSTEFSTNSESLRSTLDLLKSIWKSQ